MGKYLQKYKYIEVQSTAFRVLEKTEDIFDTSERLRGQRIVAEILLEMKVLLSIGNPIAFAISLFIRYQGVPAIVKIPCMDCFWETKCSLIEMRIRKGGF